jgi:hypothetical protein
MNTPISHTAEKEVIEEHLEQQHFEGHRRAFRTTAFRKRYRGI